MSKRSKYPRINSDRRKYDPEQTGPDCAPCTNLGRARRATRDVRVEFTYMRGEDEFVRVCDEHLQEIRDRCHPAQKLEGNWSGHWAETFRD